MNPAVASQGVSRRDAFIGWQCRVRQFAMRQRYGRPDGAVMPEVVLPGQGGSLGQIITVLNRAPEHSSTPELDHISARTHDPAERLQQALKYLSAGYYQTHRRFSDVLTATFPLGSVICARLLESGGCLLRFDAYSERFDLSCRVWRLDGDDWLFRSTLAHNLLFNPALQPGIEVLGFVPDWLASSSEPRAA